MPSFAATFKRLTDHQPFPWQERLFERFVDGDFPASCSLPTGLGKTSVIAIWLLALAQQDYALGSGRVPRRLVYVVNRRTIVDQATREAEKLRERLEREEISEVRQQLQALRGAGAEGPPLAISTLRGQFADNGEWSADPARAAIIVGTVDMIGSRLLFSGYGRGFRSRPLHAGFLGQDSLLVHDEAHLEPAFQTLLETIVAEQSRCREFRPLRVMPLTATPRRGEGEPFGLNGDDEANATIAERMAAMKKLVLHPLEDQKNLAGRLAALALARAEQSPGAAILVFARTVREVEKASDALPKGAIEVLTGTLRGLERDRLVERPIFQRFLHPSNRRRGAELPDGAVFLVCTSAGEVGIDISADHLVCDLTTFESMAQRFGRVNRYGTVQGTARIDVVHPESFGEREYEQRCARTLGLLRRLEGDASLRALAAIPPDERIAAFSPEPRVLPATDILFDAWALTSVCKPLTGFDAMPGRPPVADWLHGIAEWEPPETQVAWREEVGLIKAELLGEHKPEELLDAYPIKPHELLRDSSERLLGHLKAIAKRSPEAPVWLVDDRVVEPIPSLSELVERGVEAIHDRTVLLPPLAGGLSSTGMLDGSAAMAEDVADEWYADAERTIRRRARLWDGEVPGGMRLVRSIDFGAGMADDAWETDEESSPEEADGSEAPAGRSRLPGQLWRWCTRPRSADDEGSRAAAASITLEEHTADVRHHTERLVASHGLATTEEGRALVHAAAWHDTGKGRRVWQRAIRNEEFPRVVLAKSGSRRPPLELGRYRHEFGSLLDVLDEARTPAFTRLSPHERDMALHCIATHHGRARPHFPAAEAFDEEHDEERAAAVAREVPRRFARLQRRYGRWGLAYLESILRAADAAASASPSLSEARS